MNHTEIVLRIADRTGIAPADCDKVVRALEEVLEESLSEKRWKGRLFDAVLGVMNTVLARREARETRPADGEETEK